MFFTLSVQLQFIWNLVGQPSAEKFLVLGARRIPLVLVRNARARRYVLRLRADGSARVTIPRGGSAAEARRFAERNSAWLEQQLQLQRQTTLRKEWLVGTEILFRGEQFKVEARTDSQKPFILFGDQVLKVADSAADLRPMIERHLWKLATKELTPRVMNYATAHQVNVSRITVRNQRSRWGSCSRRGTISLNWRLIQTPTFVQDYIILHELMHLRHMNHSARFWREVERVCPAYDTAERWLKQHSALLK